MIVSCGQSDRDREFEDYMRRSDIIDSTMRSEKYKLDSMIDKYITDQLTKQNLK